MNNIKQTLIRLLPDCLFLLYKGYGWYGDFRCWEEAKKITEGYESDNILQTVKESSLKVKNGEAVYERDSVLFDKIEYTWEVLSALLWIAAQNKGSLNVIDFGGSLGSTYYQNKDFLDKIPHVLWNIVEQPNFVKEGKVSFENDRLKFYFSIQECIENSPQPVDIILLSGVLPYIEDPYDLLTKIINKKFPYILIDRTGFTLNNRDRLTVQKVPSSIYKASYPSWFLGEEKFRHFFKSNGYSLVMDFEALDVVNIPSKYKGFLYKLG